MQSATTCFHKAWLKQKTHLMYVLFQTFCHDVRVPCIIIERCWMMGFELNVVELVAAWAVLKILRISARWWR
jgi:hypothetical protein